MFLGVFASAAFAGCAYSAYSRACTACTFDTNGKIDPECQSGHQASGTTCVSSTYPIMSAKYAKGECPDVDACASELRSCVAQYSGGSDLENCREGSVGVCYSTADVCVSNAAKKCGEIEAQCPGSSATFILLMLGIGFVRIRGG